jgi:hypothetical protein
VLNCTVHYYCDRSADRIHITIIAFHKTDRLCSLLTMQPPVEILAAAAPTAAAPDAVELSPASDYVQDEGSEGPQHCPRQHAAICIVAPTCRGASGGQETDNDGVEDGVEEGAQRGGGRHSHSV